MKELDKPSRDLVQWMVKHPDEVIRQRHDIQERLVKRRCLYGDATMQTTLMPLILKPKALELIRRTSELMDRIVDKVVDLFFTDDQVRESFPAHFEIPMTWIEGKPGYAKSTVLNRLDVIFDGKTLKFIEFNTDNPGGRGWTDTIEDIFAESSLYQDLISNTGYVPGSRRIDQLQFEALMACFNEWSGGAEKPRLAIASYAGIGSRGDDEIVRDYFIEKGVEANLIDPRDFELSGGRLRSNGVTFNLLLRGMTSRFFLKYPRELREFVRGVNAGAVCTVNSFRGTLGSEKSILSFLSNPLNHHYFTPEEARAIKDHIPWTRKFDETVTLSPDGDEVSIKAFMANNRERLVIKPTTGAGGYGVMVGKTTDPLVWLDTIDDHIGSPYWIVQDYVEIPTVKLPIIKANKVVVESRYLNLSPYVFGGRYAGMLGRVSSQDVINVSAGGGVIPVFPGREG